MPFEMFGAISVCPFLLNQKATAHRHVPVAYARSPYARPLYSGARQQYPHGLYMPVLTRATRSGHVPVTSVRSQSYHCRAVRSPYVILNGIVAPVTSVRSIPTRLSNGIVVICVSDDIHMSIPTRELNGITRTRVRASNIRTLAN